MDVAAGDTGEHFWPFCQIGSLLFRRISLILPIRNGTGECCWGIIMKRFILLLPILGIATTNAVAEAPTMLSTIVVSATRSEQSTVPTPASISVISSDDIEKSGARNVAELLRGRGGIQVSDKYGDNSTGSIFDMRGFGDAAVSNTLIMVDGRRLNNSSDIGAPDVSTIALKDIERIEIIQGSAGTLFGNQAVGGVINIITRRPQEFHADVGLEIGSYGSRSLTASVSNRFSNGVSYRLSAEKRESDNYRDNSDVDYGNLLARVDYEYSGGRIFGEFNYTDEDRELPGSLLPAQLEADRRQSTYADYTISKTKLSRFGLSHDLSNEWKFDAEFAYRDTDVDAYFWGAFDYQKRDVYTLTPRLIGVIPMNGLAAQLTIGADFEMTDYSYDYSWGGSTEVDQRIYAYYLQGVLPINNSWSATAGIRKALVRNDATDSTAFTGGTNLDDDVTVGTLGIVYRPDQSFRLFVRIDENFRFAKVDEHNLTELGQTGLKNQTGISYEIGGEWNTAYGSFKATAYELNLEDEISYDATVLNLYGWGLTGANVNLDSTKRKGLVLEARTDITENIDLGFNYGYVDAKVTSGTYAGSEVPFVAKHSVSLLIDYRPASMLNLHAEVKYVGKKIHESDFANELPKLDSYTVVNLSGDYLVGGWTLGANVNNLFDKKYIEYGLKSKLSPAVAYFPSPERNFWLTVGYDFY